MKQKIFKSLLKNKRGAISGLISSIGDIIKTAFDTIPRPIKFILFLLLLLVAGTLIQSSLHLFGVFCDSADHPVNIGLNIFNNIDLISEIPSTEFIGVEAIGTANLQRGVEECSQYYESGTIIYDDGTKENFTERWFYNGRACTTCEIITVDPEGFTLTGNQKLCLGDALRQSNEDKSLLDKWFCGKKWFGRCEPPEHYYYDSAINLYMCEDETCEGITMGMVWDDKLQEQGATYLYPEGTFTKTSYDKFVSITCSDIKPNITVYSIPIFDYRMWILLTLVIILIWVLTKLKGK